MPRTCPITGKSYRRIKSRSHSMQITIQRKSANFIVKRVGNKKVKIAAKAWKTIRTKKQNLADVLKVNE